MPTSPRADCFGPGSGGSGQAVTVQGANALGIVVEAAKSRNQLNPLLLTDTFVSQGFGLGVCGIGGFAATGSAFWYTKVNHAGLQVGGSQFPIHAGDQVLWYLAPNFPPPPELVLNVPVRQPVGAPFPVQVLAYDDTGAATPAAGAVISGSGAPVTTDASGNALVERQRDGLSADPGDARRRYPQRGDADLLVRHGHRMPGSSRAGDRGDRTPPTRSPARPVTTRSSHAPGTTWSERCAGDDRIDVRGGGKDHVNCGGGTDSVKADKRDKLAKNCEQRSRGGKKHKHGKHKGKGKKR